MGIKISGLDEMRRRLSDLQRRAEDLGGTHSVRLSEILTDGFMRNHTTFESFDAMVKAGGFKVDTEEDLETIPDAAWDAVVRKTTKFADWRDMTAAATKEWVARKLGF